MRQGVQTNMSGDLRLSVMHTLQMRLVDLGKCPNCKGELSVIRLAGHPQFSPLQCDDCLNVYFVDK